MMKSKLLCAALACQRSFPLAGRQAQAADCGNNGTGFSGFIKAVHKEAAAQGIGRQALAVLDGITYDAGIVKKDRAQNIFSQSFLEFQARMITDYRIKHGAELVQKHKATFARVEKAVWRARPGDCRLLGPGNRFRRQHRRPADRAVPCHAGLGLPAAGKIPPAIDGGP